MRRLPPCRLVCAAGVMLKHQQGSVMFDSNLRDSWRSRRADIWQFSVFLGNRSKFIYESNTHCGQKVSLSETGEFTTGIQVGKWITELWVRRPSIWMFQPNNSGKILANWVWGDFQAFNILLAK